MCACSCYRASYLSTSSFNSPLLCSSDTLAMGSGSRACLYNGSSLLFSYTGQASPVFMSATTSPLLTAGVKVAVRRRSGIKDVVLLLTYYYSGYLTRTHPVCGPVDMLSTPVAPCIASGARHLSHTACQAGSTWRTRPGLPGGGSPGTGCRES